MWTAQIVAQIDKVQPTFLHQAVLLFIGILGGWAAVATIAGVFLKRKRLVEPQPLEVKQAQNNVTESICCQRHSEIDKRLGDHGENIRQLWERINHDKETFESSARARSAALYDKIDEVRKELKADIEGQRESMEKKLESLPERLVALLRNTGAIGRRQTDE